jgi:TonB family protein
MDAVEQVLRERARLERGGRLWGGLAAAALLHAGAFAAAFLLASWRPPAPRLDYVPVTLLPAQALGVERPRARPRPPAPAPTPPAPAPPAADEPPPAPKPQAPPAPKPPPEPKLPKPARRETEHEIPPEVERRPALRNVQEESLPKPERARPERQPPARESGRGSAKEKATGKRAPERAVPSQGPSGPGGLADVGKGDELGRRGSSTGNPLGSSAFGSSIAGLEDPDFGYGYYIDRLLQLIDANWTRPPVGGEVKTVVFFRIQKSGQITDLRVEQPSGYNAFDLAALRAVQNAAPFPALPASYRHDSLGVNLIVH